MERYVPTKYTGLGQMEKEHEGLNTRFKWEIPLKRWRVCYSVLVRQATSATESNNKRWPHAQHPTHSTSFVSAALQNVFFWISISD